MWPIEMLFMKDITLYKCFLCMVCFISSLCPYLNSGNMRIPSLAGATPLFSFLGANPSGWEVVQKHRWSVHSAPGCHSCVELPSLDIISPSDIFNGQSDRQCKQAWLCREAINFDNSSEQFVPGADGSIQWISPGRIQFIWCNSILYGRSSDPLSVYGIWFGL